LGKGGNRFGLNLDLPRGADLLVHFASEIAQPQLAVTLRPTRNQPRDGLVECKVGFIVALEIEQSVHQRSPFALGDADREEKKDGVIGGLLHLDALFVEVRSDHFGWNPFGFESAVSAASVTRLRVLRSRPGRVQVSPKQ